MITIDWIKENGCVVLEVITGSKAYGLNTAKSDTDIRGVYILPETQFFSLNYPEQLSNETNDIVYYELRRFLELLAGNNPNILELLNVPPNCVLYRHPVMERLQPRLFLSKLCRQSFANYAFTQIKKAQGLEKKIVNPMDAERKSILDFCFVYQEKRTVSLTAFLNGNGFQQQQMGLASIPHLRDCYNLYHSSEGLYHGILQNELANDVALSSIASDVVPVGLLYFNKDGYSVYCKKYKEYWDWVAKRNDERYKTTMSHGKKYDSKNMMHVFRLLHMAKEIATEGQINVHRGNRVFLLDVKEGKFEYDNLVAQAQALHDDLEILYKKSTLPDAPDMEAINTLLVEIRKAFYEEQKK
jgi:uncharacterized protein